MNFSLLLILGTIAGGTILIGLLLGRFQLFNSTVRMALSMLAAGILTFLLVEILSEATSQTSLELSNRGFHSYAVLAVILMITGFFLGFVGPILLHKKWVTSSSSLSPGRMSLMIAIGIGLHNLSEGLAIGQSAVQGMTDVTFGLVVGFALHNATEGFGIISPLIREGKTLSWKQMGLLTLIGGGPTFIGTLIGGFWISQQFSIFVLSMAGGSLLYVIFELFSQVKREKALSIIMSALVFGFAIGWGTEVFASFARHVKSQGNSAMAMREADGDVIQMSPASNKPKLPSQVLQQQEQISTDLLHEKALQPIILPDGTKQYNLTASAFPWEVYPGQVVNAWGYNKQVPGPVIRLKVGEKVAIVLHNQLPQPTTLHLHGLALPNSMDGIPNVTQKPIPPGGSFTYRFTVTPQMIGTHLYHSHVNEDFQMDQGLHGVLIVDPATPSSNYDIDAVYEIASWKINNSETENVFTMNGKAFPEAPELNVKQGQRVLVRLINASAEEFHTIHLHGYTFQVVSQDGNPLDHPQSLNTVTLGPGETVDIAFKADNPGKWMFHCHVLDHTVNPGENGDGSAQHMADMGGLMTFINVK
jgi:zinc transporter ZupT